LGSVFAGATAIGMLDLALLLFGRQLTGSLGAAGVVTGAFGVGNAVGLPLQARLIDRFGLVRVLAPAGLLCGGLLLGPAVGLTSRAPAALAVVTALAGLCLPAATAGTRVLLRDLVAEPAVRPAGYALLAVLFQLGLLNGPLLVAGLVAVTGPRAAVVAAGGLACASGVLPALSPAARGPGVPRKTTHAARPTSYPGVRTLVTGAAGTGLAAGLTGVGVPAVALARGVPALSGVLLSLASVGMLLGGLAWGARPRRATSRHLMCGQVGVAAAALGVAVSTGWLPAFGVGLFLGGACAAPVSVTASGLLDTVAGRPVLARAYALMVCVQLLGSSAGYVLGGSLAPVSPALTFGCAAAALTATTAWTRTRRGSLGAAGGGPSRPPG
jgi:MFS family permease